MQHVVWPEGVGAIDGWALHAWSRAILDAGGHGLCLSKHALDESRTLLDAYGNMSSATLMFVLNHMLKNRVPEKGVALALGPGSPPKVSGFHDPDAQPRHPRPGRGADGFAGSARASRSGSAWRASAHHCRDPGQQANPRFSEPRRTAR